MKKLVLLCFLAFWGGISSLFASHFMGAELSYEYLDSCTYRVYCTVYQDCANAGASGYLPPNINNPINPPGISISSFTCPLMFTTQNWVVYSTTDVTNACPGSFSMCYANGNPAINGVIEVTYYQDISFCNTTCNTATIQYSNCCRNYVITSGAGGQNLYTGLTLPLTFDNSSPRLLSPPITYIPFGQTSVFQQVAFDKEADSLVYSFAPCFQNTGQTVTYNPGYSPTSPLGASWNCSINSQTGEVTFVPNPGNIATGVIGIQIDEYRNGVFLGSIHRDMQVSVLNVNTTVNTEPTATISNVSGAGFQNPPAVLRTAVGYPLSFQLTVTDPDPGQLLDFTSNILSQFPTATLTANGNTSPMVLTFSWTPDSTYAEQNLPLVINAFDNNCELNGHYYFLTTIQVDSAYLLANITDANCTFPTGAIDLTISGGYPPYTYSWNNGDTTQDLVNIVSGAYIVEITDASGNAWQTDTFYVNGIGLNATINVITPDCGISNGELSIATTGGIAPYVYIWSNGQTGDSISNLPLGGYSVDVIDALGCFYHTTTTLNYDPLDSCFSTISGILYFDENGNCVQDPLELGVANMYIDITPGGAAFTDANGYYAFTVNDTGTYHLQAILPNNANASSTCLLPNFTKDSYISLLGIDSLHNDFPIVFQPDLSVHLTESWYIPGLNHYTYINCYNLNTYSINAVLSYQHDPVLLSPVFTPTPTAYNPVTYTATWNINNLAPNANYFISAIGTTDANAQLGNTATSYANILPVTNDPTPFNNQDTAMIIIAASYDPNIKEVLPAGQTMYGLIPSNTEKLEYTIYFQNTGTWQASYVIVKDTIDVVHLDITSTEIQMTSHNCNTTVEQDSILVFTFNNINLPDSFTNEPASHGFVKYGIKLQENLPLYTKIQNKAAIYFDFNAPIITNTTTNTLYNAMNVVLVYDSITCPQDTILATVTQGRSPYQFAYSNGVQDNNNISGQSQIPANFATGTHNISVTDYYGVTHYQTFNINNVIAANANFTYNTAGNIYTFSANILNNATYLWDFGNGQTSTNPAATATYTQNGAYAVTLIVTDLCGGADTGTQTITLSVGLSPSLFQQQVNISPNPTADIVLLSFQNEARELYTLTISDVNGKVIKSILNIKEEKIIVHTNDMASGTYFWELKGKEMARGVLLVE